MKMLAIDTSTERATVALVANGAVYSEEQGSFREHAQFLIPMIERLLATAHVQLNQLDGIAFGCGPGSFTGLRITCSIAKALAYAHDLPLFPVSSLAAIAYDVYQTESNLAPDTHVLAMIDARMQQVYWGCFTPHCFAFKAHVSTVTDIVLPTTGPIILAGVGFEPYAEQLPQSIQAQIVKRRVSFPNAQAMIHLAQTGQIPSVSAADALPIYVRNQVTQGGTCG